MRIADKIRSLNGEQAFSMEFFPPKTEAGVENLFQRMDRMTALHPLFVDITFGAGGSTKDLTLSIAEYAQKYFGVDALMHLTCSGLTIDEIHTILDAAKNAGIKNILALRGDPIKGAVTWTKTPGGFNNSYELIQFIKEHYGDYFCIGIAGFPEGHPHSTEGIDADLHYLQLKVDAGAEFILTQFFYDTSVFLQYVSRCRSAGISIPIIPGLMPIQNYNSFSRMVSVCNSQVPASVLQDMEAFRSDDEAAKTYGVQLAVQMCRELTKHGHSFFHFYTLNLEKSVLTILSILGIGEKAASRRDLPWRGARGEQKEAVRPIHWANRYKSYIDRTEAWDEFPNGRWGDNRSPAFGDLSDTHFIPKVGLHSKDNKLAMWGEVLRSRQDVYAVFQRYIEGRIPILPWCEEPLQVETSSIFQQLSRLNRAGFLSINSQPAVNGELSDHSLFGWGGPGGRVYQKAYVEFFVAPEQLEALLEVVQRRPSLSLHAINSAGVYKCSGTKAVTALTWG